jgi:lipocalin-like protein
MNNRAIVALPVLAFALALMPGEASGQQTSLKDQIVGAWTLVSVSEIAPDGSKTDTFGPNPKGAYMFDANGRFTQMLMRSDLPMLESRTSGTPEQHKAVAHGTIAMYGTYTVDEPTKTIIVNFEGSSFAKFNGASGKRMVTSITADEMRTMNPATSTGSKAESVWRRVKQQPGTN